MISPLNGDCFPPETASDDPLVRWSAQVRMFPRVPNTLLTGQKGAGRHRHRSRRTEIVEVGRLAHRSVLVAIAVGRSVVETCNSLALSSVSSGNDRSYRTHEECFVGFLVHL
jgi:hypothetical protein